MVGSSSNKSLIILAMALGLLMASLDNTIVASCLNKLSEDFNVFDKISWVFTAYMLAATSTMLVFGKMSDLFGRKLFYMIGIGMFSNRFCVMRNCSKCGSAHLVSRHSRNRLRRIVSDQFHDYLYDI